jgi:hypothetical protein
VHQVLAHEILLLLFTGSVPVGRSVSDNFRKHDRRWPEHHLVLSFSAQEPPGHPLVIQSTRIRLRLYTIHAAAQPPGGLDERLAGLVAQSQALRNLKKTAER